MRAYVGSKELIDGKKRWCLWLVDATPDEIERSPELRRRVDAVREVRLGSKAATTRNYPHHHLFRQFGITSQRPIVCIPGGLQRAPRIPTGRASRRWRNHQQQGLRRVGPHGTDLRPRIFVHVHHMDENRWWAIRIATVVLKHHHMEQLPTPADRDRPAAGHRRSRRSDPGGSIRSTRPFPRGPLSARKHDFGSQGSRTPDRPWTQPWALTTRTRIFLRRQEVLFASYERLTAALLPTTRPSARR